MNLKTGAYMDRVKKANGQECPSARCDRHSAAIPPSILMRSALHLRKLVQVGHAAQHQQHRLVLYTPSFRSTLERSGLREKS